MVKSARAPEPDSEVEDALEEFRICEEARADEAKEYLDDVRFARLEEQWPAEVRRQRELDGRPCLTISKLGPIIRQVVNDARQNKPAITVHPADDVADPDTAEIYNGLIRNIETVSRADLAYDTALECAVSGGFGYFSIGIDFASDDGFEKEIRIRRIADPLTVYRDPYTTDADASDWNLAFVTEMLPRRAFERKYKGAEKVDWKLGEYSKLPEGWSDGEQVMVAARWTRDEVMREIVAIVSPMGELRIVPLDVFKDRQLEFEGWTVEGSRKVPSFKVKQQVMSGCEVLDTVEWKGRYIPIVPVYGDEVVVEGKRHFRSLIRSAKDAQRNYNYWRTSATELVALAPKAPWVGEQGAFSVDPNWSSANSASHPYLEYKKGTSPPQRQPFTGVPAGDLQMAINADDDIKSITGVHNASLGLPSNETSGRAIMARQREGDVSTFHFIDNLTRAIRYAGLVLIDLIPAVYNQERVVRVLGREGEPSTVRLKTPVPVMDENGQPAMDEAGAPVTRMYDLALGKYDLTVKAGPSFTSRREEAAAQMIEFIRSYPAAAPLIGDLLAKNLDWPGAEEMGRRLKAMLPPQIQGENPDLKAAQQQLQEMQQALQQALQAAETAKADNSAEGARIKLEEGKLEVEQYRAETERFKALAPKGVALPEQQIMQMVLGIIGQLITSSDVDPGNPGAGAPPAAAAPTIPPVSPMGAQPQEIAPQEAIAPPAPEQPLG